MGVRERPTIDRVKLRLCNEPSYNRLRFVIIPTIKSRRVDAANFDATVLKNVSNRLGGNGVKSLDNPCTWVGLSQRFSTRNGRLHHRARGIAAIHDDLPNQ